MDKYDFGAVKIVIADPNSQIRQGLKGALHSQGFRGIHDAFSFERLREAIRYENPDLLLCDMGFSDGDVCDLIKRLRHNELGANPFMVIILFSATPTSDQIAKIVDCGVDDIIIKPIVATQVMQRVTALIRQRKPFVVTTDYVGPDRRKKPRAGCMEIPIIEVPNSLAAKAHGDKEKLSDVQKQIDAALMEINEQKIERHAFQVNYLVERIVPAYMSGKVNDEIRGYVTRLVYVSQDIQRRLETSAHYQHVAELCSTLAKVAMSVRNAIEQPSPKDLKLLTNLTQAVAKSCRMEERSVELARDISEAMTGYKGSS